jgi:hypothetical protein
MVNSDTEASDGSGANNSQVTFNGSASGSSVTAGTFIGDLIGNVTGNASGSASKLTTVSKTAWG